MGHEMLVRENKNIVDNFALAGAKAPSPCAVIRRGADGSNSSAAALDNGMRNYIKRQRPAKLDLNLTLLQVLDGQRGGGSHVRTKDAANSSNFLPQIAISPRNEAVADQSTDGIYLHRDEKMF